MAPPVARDESTANFGELHETEPLEQVLKRQVLAERHEMNLVIDGKDRAAVADHANRIVGPRDGGARRGLKPGGPPKYYHRAPAPERGKRVKGYRRPAA